MKNLGVVGFPVPKGYLTDFLSSTIVVDTEDRFKFEQSSIEKKMNLEQGLKHLIAPKVQDYLDSLPKKRRKGIDAIGFNDSEFTKIDDDTSFLVIASRFYREDSPQQR